MWSSRVTRRAGFLGLLALAACGFQPALGPGSEARALYGQVRFDAPKSETDFAFASRLAERLGLADTPRWRLDYSISTNRQGASAEDATRIVLTASATYKLVPLVAGARAQSGTVDAFTSFTQARTSATETAFLLSNRAAEQAARDRLVAALADKLVDALIAGAGT